MRITRLILLSLVGIIITALIQGCGATSAEEGTLVSGVVQEQSSGTAISGAILEITSPEEFGGDAVTDQDGLFSFTIENTETVDLQIEVTAEGYNTVTRTVKVAPGSDITNLTINLTSSDQDGGDGDDSGGIGGQSGGADAIILTGQTEDVININESGGVVSSTLTFEVQDSAGRSLDLNQATMVQFTIVGGTGDGGAVGEEYLTPEEARTNANGQVKTNLRAGNTSGVVKIRAEINREDIGITIQSEPITVAIHGGFPDPDHFSISIEQFNFEGFSRDGVRNQVMAVVADKFSNPVKPGTPVYFDLSAGGNKVGSIQGSGRTDEDGLLEVDIISGGNRDLLNHPTHGFGYATVTAYTFDENNNQITKTIPVLFSGPPSHGNIELTWGNHPDPFEIPANGGETFSLTVTDINNNPLPAGTTVTIEVAEGLEVTGGDIEIPNALTAGSGTTEFSFSVADTDDENSNTQDTQITIEVETPIGDKASRSFGGTRAKR